MKIDIHEPALKTVTLEDFPMMAAGIFGDGDMLNPENIDVEVFKQVMYDEFEMLAMKIKAHILSEKLQDIEIRYPENWTESVKERWFPEWLKKRFPVHYKTHHIEARAFYPMVSIPEQSHYVRIISGVIE